MGSVPQPGPGIPAEAITAESVQAAEYAIRARTAHGGQLDRVCRCGAPLCPQQFLLRHIDSLKDAHLALTQTLAEETAAAPALCAQATTAERAARDAAYAERDRLVAALSKCYPSHLTRHQGDDWQDDWRNIVCIHLPPGQATWHIHDTELPWFAHLTQAPAHWDGHTTDEKYRRLADLLEPGTNPTPTGDPS